MNCKETGQCRSAAACFLSGGCIETGEKWEQAGGEDIALGQLMDKVIAAEQSDTTKGQA